MEIKTHITIASVQPMIDRWKSAQNAEPYEDGPSAHNDLMNFVLWAIGEGKADDPVALAAHVRQEIHNYWEE